MRPLLLPYLLVVSLFCNCTAAENISAQQDSISTLPNQPMYFPPLSGSDWQTTPISSLNWNESAVQPLLDYLIEKNSKSFIVLVNGKIVMENYFDGHSASTPWYWASAGKTLTSTMFGIAQQEGYVSIDDRASQYIGIGWTSAPLVKENMITNRNLLNMTSGLDDSLGDDVSPTSLLYKADAGSRWAYHNVFVKLQDVISNATNQLFTNYFNTKLRDKIGMNGAWFTSGNNIVYSSNTRSMARFGLLMLNKGNWDGTQILNETYFNDATSNSQNINQAYGYLWWLNGKSNYHLPQSQMQFPGSIIPSAPQDLFMALGKKDQKIYVIPSKKMVIVRMGNAADLKTASLSDFDTVLWQKINALYQ